MGNPVLGGADFFICIGSGGHGGIGILVGLIVGMLTGIYCIRDETSFFPIFRLLMGVTAGAAIACFVGLVDDIFDIKPWQKLLGQVVAAAVLVAVGIRPALNILPSHLAWKCRQMSS